MKLKYNCQIYDTRGEKFVLLAKGTEIRVVQIDKRTVKIEWDKEGDSKYKTGFGYISHRQFIIGVEQERKDVKKNGQCEECLKFGNCGLSRIKSIPCEYFEERSEYETSRRND